MRSLLAGRPPEQVELAESLLVPMISQMGQMQTQMLDQFQQMMMMMFQMFTTMHREQMDVVKEEMAQIRHLTEELQSAQALLREKVEASREPAPPSPSPRPGGPPRIRLASPQPNPEAPPSSETSRKSGSRSNEPAAPPSSTRRAGADAAGDPSHQLHTLLAQRIAAIQEERQTRWQRLVQMLSGGGGGGSSSGSAT